MALPGKDYPEGPGLLAGAQWNLSDQWAWILANRADQYTEDLPAETAEALGQSRIALSKDWTVHASEEGLAVVRRSLSLCKGEKLSDPLPWMLAGTRYVDLALLVQRAGRYLQECSKQLRDKTLDSSRADALLGRKNPTQAEIDEASQSLSDSLNKFQTLQQDFVLFRDHLWFETVASQDVGSMIYRGVQRNTGIRDHYNDILTELDLRRNVYAVQYQALQVQVQELKNDIQKQTNEIRAREAENREQFNTGLALIGAALAIPSLIQLYPFANDKAAFWISTVIVVLLLLGYLAYSRRKK